MLGVDGYISFALAQHLLKRGHILYGVDAFYRRRNVEEEGLDSIIPITTPKQREETLKELGNYTFKELDIATQYEELAQAVKTFKPDAIVNLAQIPSAPFSMKNPKNALWTIENNVGGTLNVLWAMKEHAPDSHLVILGTMGIYSFPHTDIPEGFFQIEYHNKSDILPFPTQPGSVYHSSKAMMNTLNWFASRIWEQKITEVSQGCVYGTRTSTMTSPELYTRFDIGEQFGTMINRAVACAVIGYPILVYGSGMQQRAYIQLQDSINCLTLLTENPPTQNDSIRSFRVVNQFDDYYSCNDLADTIKRIGNEEFGLNVQIQHIENPRVEAEYHYYNPIHEKLYKMGWKPKVTFEDGIRQMIKDLQHYVDRIIRYEEFIRPKIKWRNKK